MNDLGCVLLKCLMVSCCCGSKWTRHVPSLSFFSLGFSPLLASVGLSSWPFSVGLVSVSGSGVCSVPLLLLLFLPFLVLSITNTSLGGSTVLSLSTTDTIRLRFLLGDLGLSSSVITTCGTLPLCSPSISSNIISSANSLLNRTHFLSLFATSISPLYNVTLFVSSTKPVLNQKWHKFCCGKDQRSENRWQVSTSLTVLLPAAQLSWIFTSPNTGVLLQSMSKYASPDLADGTFCA